MIPGIQKLYTALHNILVRKTAVKNEPKIFSHLLVTVRIQIRL